MKVATVVVTYNRKEDLLKNINEQMKQTLIPDQIIIIDNHSTDGTYDFLKENGINEKEITYCYLDENLGGAGGFEYGTKLAYEKDYDYVILMDDDGRPINSLTFENLICEAESLKVKNKRLMLNSIVKCNDSDLSFSLMGTTSVKDAISQAKDNIILNTISPFNGTLLSRETICAIGCPNGVFFIKGDEADYYMRARKSDVLIATVINSEYFHPSLAMKKLNVFGRKMLIPYIEKPWKEYYRSRNYTYMFRNNGSNCKALILCIMRVATVLFMKCEKVKCISMIYKGYRDGKMGKMGKTILP